MKIYPYKARSGSVLRISEALGIPRLLREGKPIKAKSILNWGCHRIRRDTDGAVIFNHPGNVAVAGNKLKTFKALQGHVGIPEWTESVVEAHRWLREGATVVRRETLTGNSGEGIEIVTPEMMDGEKPLKAAPLFTKLLKRKDEYRVHVAFGKAIMLQRKARRLDVPNEEVNWKIRNHANGFIFAHKDVVVPDVVVEESISAVRVLGLDFGAVDILLGVDGLPYVLEVNTAPGIEGETLARYVEAFKEYV